MVLYAIFNTQLSRTKIIGRKMSKISQYKERLEKFLNEENAFTNALGMVEEKTKIKRLHIFLGVVAFFSLYLIFGYGCALIVNALGAVYPAYCSVKAVESPQKDDDTQWLIYWIVFSGFTIVEYFSDFLFSWFPFYFLAKLIFLVWCMAPISSNGANVIYNRLIKPFVVKHQKEIDDALNEIKNEASAQATKVADKAQNEVLKQYMKNQQESDEDRDEDKKDM